jgi:serine/threonine-protein kinase
LLGRGGHGEVFEAEHLALSKRVVVKLLHRKLLGRPDLSERLRLEGQALAHLRHPNLVSVTDFQITGEGRPFLVMERLHGRTLRDELTERGELPVREAVDLVRQALAGLAVVHEAGLVHRDIKPDNLFLCDAETPGSERVLKLLDFGVAKVVGAQEGRVGPLPKVRTDQDMTLGTPRWFSPEQASFREVDARADLYSLGLVLYALLAGRNPFDHYSGMADLVLAHTREAPTPLSRAARQPIPTSLEAAVLTALSKKPDDRFSSAVAFSQALVHALRPAPRWASTEPLAPLVPKSTPSPVSYREEEGDDEHSISEDPTQQFRRPPPDSKS